MSLSMNRALAIAAHVGMPVRTATAADHVTPDDEFFVPASDKEYIRFSWNGKALLVTANRKPIDIIHEAAHWLVATPKERRMPEFGLGNAPYGDTLSWRDVDTSKRQVISERYLDSEKREIQACTLELQILWACNGKWRARADYLNFEPPRRGDFWDWIRRERDYPADSPLFARSYAESLAAVTKHTSQVMRRARGEMSIVIASIVAWLLIAAGIVWAFWPPHDRLRSEIAFALLWPLILLVVIAEVIFIG